MRKAALIFILGFAMLACSVSDINNLLPATPTAGMLSKAWNGTPSLTPSITSTQPTPTFTITPTLFYTAPTETPNLMLIPTATLWILGGPSFQGGNLKTPEPFGFSSYLMSGNILHWGKCQPNSIKVIARPSNIIKTHYVLLFLRLKDQKSDDMTEWGSGGIMDSDGKGTFYYNLTAQNLPGYRDFGHAWIQYQFVATDKHLNVIGRTMVILNGISYSPCP